MLYGLSNGHVTDDVTAILATAWLLVHCYISCTAHSDAICYIFIKRDLI